jgi:hypothetical protein
MWSKEFERLQAVHRFMNLEVNRTEDLQEIVEFVAELSETSIAMITLMNEHTQYIEFKVGTNLFQTVKEDTFCRYLNDEGGLLIVEDARKDRRFKNNPVVLGEPFVRFYAGAPLVTNEGFLLGSLCVMDSSPRVFSRRQMMLLKMLAKRVIEILEFELSVSLLKKQFARAEMADIKLRSFFYTAGACHLLIGKDMEIIAFNKSIAVFLEKMYAIEVYTGMKIQDIITEEGQYERFLTNYPIALSGKSVQYEIRMVFKEEIIWWSVTLEPGLNAEDEIIGISFNAIDITKIKLHEQQILEQNEALLRIAHIQSHELRKPVATILGFMELFKLNNYSSTSEELLMMGKATQELDDKIRAIVNLTQ